MNTKKEIIYSIVGVVTLIGLILFTIFCPWSQMVWFVLWCVAMLAWAIMYSRYVEARRILDKVMTEYASTLIRTGEMTAYANVLSQAHEQEEEKTDEETASSDAGGEG